MQYATDPRDFSDEGIVIRNTVVERGVNHELGARRETSAASSDINLTEHLGRLPDRI